MMTLPAGVPDTPANRARLAFLEDNTPHGGIDPRISMIIDEAQARIRAAGNNSGFRVSARAWAYAAALRVIANGDVKCPTYAAHCLLYLEQI